MAKKKSVPSYYQSVMALALVLLLSLLSLITGTATASTDEVKWSKVNIPTEGKPGNWVLAKNSDIQHLTMAANGALYAYAKGLTYTLYRSIDDGVSWSYIGNVTGQIVDIAPAPGDANVIYYATSSNVYRSIDGGKNFYQLGPSPGGAGSGNVEITSIDVIQVNSRYIAVGTRDTGNTQFGGVYLLDEGQVIPGWTSAGLIGYDVYTVAFSPSFVGDRQLVAVVTDETDTIVTTKIGSSAWGAVTGNARLNRDNSTVHTPVVANSAAITFPSDYESDADSDKCVLFIAIDTGTGNGDVYKIKGARAPGNSLATDLNIGAAFGVNNVDITGLAVNGAAVRANLLAGAASSSRTYFSDDGGLNWTRCRKEPTGTSKTYVLMSSNFAGSGKVYAATSGSESAFSVSQDKGLHWNQTGLIDTTITIVDLAPSPIYSKDNTLFLLTFGGEHSLWRSLDAGATWERVFNSILTNVDSLNLISLPPQYNPSNQVIFIAGVSNGYPGIWKSSDNGLRFTFRRAIDPNTGTALTIDTWAVVNDATLFISSYDGTKGRIHRTANSGFSFSTGVITGTVPLNSMALSPGYEQDRTILVGSTSGWVYWSKNDGESFEPLPADATSAPLSGSIAVAFDTDFKDNRIVYAASSTANKGVYRLTVGKNSPWESIDSTSPSGGTLSQLKLLSSGILWATNTKAGGGLERSLNPTFSLGPTFETVTRGLSDNCTLAGLWTSDHRLWTVDTTNTRLMTFMDTLSVPVKSTLPADKSAGIGTVINHTVSNVSLDWGTLSGATSYQWQIDYDTDFSSVPAGFEGTTQASTVRLPTLEPGTTYYWRVRVNAPLLSPWSARSSFITSLDTEAVALKLENPLAGARSVPIKPIFQWTAVTGAEAYELLVSTDAQFAQPSIVKVNEFALKATAWQCDIKLNYDTTYYWKVRAITANTRSAWSAVGAFITEPAPPPPPPQIITPPATPTVTPTPTPTPAISTPKIDGQPTPQLPPIIITQPPPPPPAPAPAPDWIFYLGGALFLTIILLLVIIMMLVVKIKRI